MPDRILKSALTTTQYANHRQFALPDQLPEFPSVLQEYDELVAKGDNAERIASMHRGRSTKKDAKGLTAGQRASNRAEGYYEEAIQLLDALLDTDRTRNPNVDEGLAGIVAMWLDREVVCGPGGNIGANPVEIPRIRTSTSQYNQKPYTPLSKREVRLIRDAVSVSNACVELLFDTTQDAPLSPLLKRLLAEKSR